MQTPSAVLNIGADVAKKAIAVACSEGSFPVREVANQRTATCGLRAMFPPVGLNYLATVTMILSCRKVAIAPRTSGAHGWRSGDRSHRCLLTYTRTSSTG